MEFGVGSIIEGKVTGITTFGAFVALPGGRSGLVHISEVAHTYVNDVHDYLTEGQTVQVKVIGIDESNRINLSIKKATEAPARSAQPTHGGPPFRKNGAPRGPMPPRPSRSGGPRYSQSAPHFSPTAPREPDTFEDRLKQFMQLSDSKMSDLNRNTDRRSGSRRGRH